MVGQTESPIEGPNNTGEFISEAADRTSSIPQWRQDVLDERRHKDKKEEERQRQQEQARQKPGGMIAEQAASPKESASDLYGARVTKRSPVQDLLQETLPDVVVRIGAGSPKDINTRQHTPTEPKVSTKFDRTPEEIAGAEAKKSNPNYDWTEGLG